MKYAFDRVVLLNVWGLLVLLVWNEATRPAPEAIVRVDTVTVYSECGPIEFRKDTIPYNSILKITPGAMHWQWCPIERDECYHFNGDTGKCHYGSTEIPCDSLIRLYKNELEIQNSIDA